jgi:hypothetical protein
MGSRHYALAGLVAGVRGRRKSSAYTISPTNPQACPNLSLAQPVTANDSAATRLAEASRLCLITCGTDAREDAPHPGRGAIMLEFLTSETPNVVQMAEKTVAQGKTIFA